MLLDVKGIRMLRKLRKRGGEPEGRARWAHIYQGEPRPNANGARMALIQFKYPKHWKLRSNPSINHLRLQKVDNYLFKIGHASILLYDTSSAYVTLPSTQCRPSHRNTSDQPVTCASSNNNGCQSLDSGRLRRLDNI